MRQLFPTSVLGLLGLLISGAISPPAPAAEANDPAIDPILQQLDQVGRTLKEFSAKVKLTETDNALGNAAIRDGTAYFQKKPDDSARIHVIFDRQIDPQLKLAHMNKVEYLLDGPWLIDRNYHTKNEVKRQVLRPGQKLDLFKLGEGPFPLPIGQIPADVHKAFEVRKLPPAKDDPAHTTHLELLPRPGTDLARKFHSIDVWVDEKSHMPTRVDTVDTKQQTSRSTELTNVVVNPLGGLPEGDFQLPNIDDQKWNRSVESLND